ncbi:MAG: COQ9 family protein [Paracoccaceae bacterium]
MNQGEKSMAEAKARLLAAAIPHVPFGGWSDATFRAALADSGLPEGLALALFPRGGIDLAAEWHRAGDRAMAEALAGRNDLAALKFRERVALALRLRLEGADRELVRRGTTLFALPAHAAEGAGLIWGTADAVWRALGDTSADVNWYTKRATLSAVWGASVLFWLGDETEGQAATWDFVDRRIENVMQFEKAKAAFAENPLGRAILKGPLKVLERVRAPHVRSELPAQGERPTRT